MRNHLPVPLLVALATLVFAACDNGSKPPQDKDSTATATAEATATIVDSSADVPLEKPDVEAEAPVTGQSASNFDQGEKEQDAAKTYSLSITPRKGDSYTYHVTEKNVTTIDTVTMVQTVDYEFTGSITDVNSDRSFILRFAFDRIQTRNDFPPGVVDTVARTITFDSKTDKGAKVPGADQIRALIGQPVNVTISATGNIREIANVGPIVSSLMKKAPDTLSDELRDRLRERVAQQLKVAYFLPVVRQLFVSQIPKEPVKVGATWQRTDTLPIAKGVPSTVDYRLAEVRRVDGAPVAKVVYTMNTKLGTQQINDTSMSATVKDAAIQGSATSLIDLVTGFPIRKETSILQKLTVSGKMKIGPSAGQNQTVPRSTRTTTLVKMVDFKPAKS